MGLLRGLNGRIQWEHSSGAAGLFEMLCHRSLVNPSLWLKLLMGSEPIHLSGPARE
jgi:hypothetical protein